MPMTLRRRPGRARPRFRTYLHLEALEQRSLPAVLSWPGLVHPIAEIEPNNTLDHAQNLANDLNRAGIAEVVGRIDDASAANVDWYQFTLTKPARVDLSTLVPQGSKAIQSVLSLWAPDPNDPFQSSLGYRQLAESAGEATGGGAQLRAHAGPGPITWPSAVQATAISTLCWLAAVIPAARATMACGSPAAK